MTKARLRSILAGLNSRIFDELFDGLVHDLNPDHASVSSEEAVLKSLKPCCAGRLRRQPANCRDLARHITLARGGQTLSEGQVAVGWVLDQETADEDQDLKVVVAVGINYGQGPEYLDQPVPWRDATLMRTRLDKAAGAVQAADSEDCPHMGLLEAFHLVAGNFFPWITTNAWADHGFNGIEEALLLYCHGFADPHLYLAALLQEIGAEVTHLFFHGTNTPVPLLGTKFVQRHGDLLAPKNRPVDTQVIFCDNLARPSLPVANSVGLCLERTDRCAQAVLGNR